MKNIYSLIPDIYKLFESPRELTEDFLDDFAERMKEHLREAFRVQRPSRLEKSSLRASSYGLPSRQLWFKTRARREEYSPSSIRFLIGNFVEELVLLLAKEAEHDVREEQKKLRVQSVPGTQDAKIDGQIVDVKSASSYAFKKWKDGTFLLDPSSETDSFAYRHQLSFYLEANEEQRGYFLVINKETGELVLVEFDVEDLPDVKAKIELERANLEGDLPPEEKCYPDLPYGKSGNRVLHSLCTFCEFKEDCWKEANNGKGLIEHRFKHYKVYFTDLKAPPKKRQSGTTTSSDDIDDYDSSPSAEGVNGVVVEDYGTVVDDKTDAPS